MVLLLLSFILMGLDHASKRFQQIRPVIAYITHPFYFTVETARNTYKKITLYFHDYNQLAKKNEQLHQQLIKAKVLAQQAEVLRHENHRLKSLNLVAKATSNKFIIANLTVIHTEPFLQRFVINRGTYDKIYPGQVILNEYGVVGQILKVSHDESWGAFLGDSKVSIPIYDMRSGETGIAIGSGRAGLLKLQFITADQDIRIGDKILTSGKGGHFPKGYPVGDVFDINHKQNSLPFQEILVQSAVKIKDIDYVILPH